MSLLAGVGYVMVFAVSAIVSAYCVATLVRRDGRISSRGEFSRGRLFLFFFFLLPASISLFLARRSELHCERIGAPVICTIEQRQFRRSFSRLFPANAVLGSEVEESLGTDQDGFPERKTRLVVLTSQGRYRLTDFGQLDAGRLHRQLAQFLADPAQRSLLIGQDSRWYFYPQLPMWLLLALLALIGCP